ncbi:hypothetical protein GCM10009789_74620 [Kribbella sancticallisti]|uniref:PknH-like extracellular domain-containing protein n=1 Tax=Kribbella sancticallisti TaxID=460087 RepID=A0ABP4QF89_9ACTN
MVSKRSLLSTAFAAGLALSLVACSGDDKAGSPAPSTSASSTPPPSSTPSATPSATPTPTPSAPAAPKARTKAELTKALLALADLPPGYAVEPDEGDDGSRLTSSDPKCKGVLTFFNAPSAPGSKVSATRVFSGGQEGPFVQETLDGMGSPQAVTSLIAATKKAVQSCRKAKLSIPGVGSSTVAISEISAPKTGTNPLAVRFSATSGALAGFELVFAITGLSDVVLAMSMDDAGNLEATTDAVDKATKVLGTAKTGT